MRKFGEKVMKRGGSLKRITPLKSSGSLKQSKPMRSKPRKLTPLERKWQKAVTALNYCVNCQRYGVQWAHENQGKGMGMKTHPSRTAALCPECHHNVDNGKTMTLDQRRQFMIKVIDQTHERLRRCGLYPAGEPE